MGDVVDLQTEPASVTGTIEGLTLADHLRAPVRRDAQHRAERDHPGDQQQDPRVGSRDRGRPRGDRTRTPKGPRRAGGAVRSSSSTQRPFDEGLRKEPQILGVTQTTDTAQVIRVVAETLPHQALRDRTALRERIHRAIADQGIRVPPVRRCPRRPPRPPGRSRAEQRRTSRSSPLRCRAWPTSGSVDELQTALGESRLPRRPGVSPPRSTCRSRWASRCCSRARRAWARRRSRRCCPRSWIAS